MPHKTSEVGILKWVHIRAHPLIDVVHTESVVTEDNQTTELCWPCHDDFAHCQDDGSKLGAVDGLPPRGNGADVKVTLSPNQTPLPAPQRPFLIDADPSV